MSNLDVREPLRIGILGAARIAPSAVVRPAQALDDVEARGVAARVPRRAGDFQVKHGLAVAFPSYESMLKSDEIDAVYNALPNGLHAEWTIRALEAGKHVLCEKPFASNAAEAVQMAETARRVDRRLMEAFHYRYHPLAARMEEIVMSGELGTIRHVEASICFPAVDFRDIRYDFSLGGGATMDAGCYGIHMLRFLTRQEPEVTAAHAGVRAPNVDRWMEAELQFDGGPSAFLRCSLFSRRILSVRVSVRGDDGELVVQNPVLPHLFHWLTVKTRSGHRREQHYGETTYAYQLRAFRDLVEHGTAVPTDAKDAIANMKVVDEIYDRAGLPRRGTG